MTTPAPAYDYPGAQDNPGYAPGQDWKLPKPGSAPYRGNVNHVVLPDGTTINSSNNPPPPGGAPFPPLGSNGSVG